MNNATGRRLLRTLKRVQRHRMLSTDAVTLHWRTASGASPHANRNLPASLSGTSWQEHSEVLYPLVHYVSIQTQTYVKHASVGKGDVILDFIGDVDFTGRLDLEFEIAGQRYVQKEAGGDLTASWDVRCNGVPITRSILLTPKS